MVHYHNDDDDHDDYLFDPFGLKKLEKLFINIKHSKKKPNQNLFSWLVDHHNKWSFGLFSLSLSHSFFYVITKIGSIEFFFWVIIKIEFVSFRCGGRLILIKFIPVGFRLIEFNLSLLNVVI